MSVWRAALLTLSAFIAARVQFSYSPLVVVVAQSVRASDCGSEGCEFKSRRSPSVRGVRLVWSGH